MCQSFSHVWLFVTPWTVAHQALLSMGFSGQEYWSGLPFPSPEDLPDPRIKPGSPVLQADCLLSKPQRSLLHHLPSYLSIDSHLYPYLWALCVSLHFFLCFSVLCVCVCVRVCGCVTVITSSFNYLFRCYLLSDASFDWLRKLFTSSMTFMGSSFYICLQYFSQLCLRLWCH